MHDDIANQEELFDKIFSSCFELKDEKLPYEIHLKVKSNVKTL